MRRSLPAALALALLACQPRVDTAPDPASLEAELRARSAAIVAAEQAEDLEAIMRFYLPDAVVHMDGAPPTVGHDAIRAVYRQFFDMPMVSFEGTDTNVEVAASGDLAYETGVNDFVLNAAGAQVAAKGKYLAVWRRGADGLWRIAALAVTNDQTQR